jgi:hypothetical protein|tara:strand:+ start:346 stop:489 length:144 start_codon:yes stop_codon:yes gene_type:complete
MKPQYSKDVVVEKTYKQDGIKVTRYAPVKHKPQQIPRCNRKPTYGLK